VEATNPARATAATLLAMVHTRAELVSHLALAAAVIVVGLVLKKRKDKV